MGPLPGRRHLHRLCSKGSGASLRTMATELSYTQQFTGTPAQVYAMLTDAAFGEHCALNTGSTSAECTSTASGAGATVVSKRVLPAEVPGFAKKFLGDTITLTETQEWSGLNGDAADAVVTVEFSAPISFTGAAALRAAGEGTEVLVTGKFKASIPLIGGKVEELARDTTSKYLHKQAKLGNAWLAR